MGSSKPSTESRRLLALVLALVASSAEAQTPAVRVNVGRTQEVRVDRGMLVAGETRVPFPLGRVPSAPPTVENLSVGGARYAILRYREGDATVEALIGASGVVHVGRADLHGDPGERTRETLRITRDRGVGVVRETEDERVRRCDGARLVRTRALDGATGHFVAVPRAGDPSGEALQLASGEGPERSLAPLLRMTGADFEASPTVPEANRELQAAFDGRSGTFVTLDAPSSLARPTMVGRWEGGARYPLRGLVITPRPAGATAPPPAWIRFTVNTQSFVARFPADVAAGTRFYAVLPETETRCVEVEVGPPSSGSSSALGDIAFLASFDLENGLARVVDDLSAGGEAGTLAADVLSRAGEDAARLLAPRFAEMPAGERRLAVRVVARMAERSETARGVLGLALADADETVQRAALEATRAMGDAGLALLAERLARGGLGVAGELTRRAPARALTALLARASLAEISAEDRAALRPLIVEAGRRASPEEVARALAAVGEVSLEARADIGIAAASLPGAASFARATAESLSSSEEFVARHKALLISRALPADERGDTLLAFATRSLDAEEWMIRAAAIGVAGAPTVPTSREHRLRLLEDAYPRVRVAAIEAGPLDDTLVVPVARLARLDDWPIVRAAGVRAIAADARTRPIQRAAVRDRAERVRVAAITVLTETRDTGAFEQIEGRLTAPGEVPDVYRAALRYVRSLCVHAAVPAVADLLDRMARDESTLEIAQEAALALTALGTEDARDALARAPGNVRGPLDAPNATRPTLCVPAESP